MIRTLKIRKAKPSDVNAIYWLRRTTFKRLNARDYSQEQITSANEVNTHRRILEKMLDREMFCLVKRTGFREVILGTADLEDEKIGGLFVKWNYTGKGCGSLLLEFIERYAAKKGIEKLSLKSTKYARDFYLKRGYTPKEGPRLSLEIEKALK